MIDIKKFRENPQFFNQSSANKGVQIDVEKMSALDMQLREQTSELEAIRAQKNAANDRIAKASKEEREEMIASMRALGGKEQELIEGIRHIEQELTDLLRSIPNPSLPDVKVGKDESENEVIRVVGEVPTFDFPVKDHLAVCENLGLIDMKRAAAISSARFYYLHGDLVLLEMALTKLAMQAAIKHGFVPTTVPHMITEDAMRAMGYFEHGGTEEIYHLEKDNLFLIGTAEQPLGAMHKDEILDEKDLPLRYVGVSPCYRREAGSYGKDTRGLIRVHQFNKVEMFSFTTAEDSDAEHMKLLAIEEEIMQSLGLSYRVIKQCTGDLGSPAARKFDIEAWVPSQNTYRETHSTSTCTDYQARRLGTRVRRTDGRVELVHTLNGTALSMARILAVLIDNYQQADGSIKIPEVLRNEIGKDAIKK
jgi:seryl-tRNA synthetase